jgi:membrane associated rhomboid family serine protease
MRNAFSFNAPTPNVTRFLILIIASYLIFAIIGRNQVGVSLFNAMVLSPFDVLHSFEAWRILSYAILHDPNSPMHVIFNALALYMLGPQLEDRWGEKRFLIFVLTAIVLGGVMVCLTFLLGISSASVVGFSAATIGLVIAWGLTFSTQQIFLLGILPLSGQQLVYITVGLEVIYAVSGNSISSAAHFGGIIAGFIFTLGLYKPRKIKQMWHQSRNQFRP